MTQIGYLPKIFVCGYRAIIMLRALVIFPKFDYSRSRISGEISDSKIRQSFLVFFLEARCNFGKCHAQHLCV